MLKLKKLQVLGFKSFCDRTELRFHGDGIAAIIGPNGCGKSNISDAISWVLGEQSAKSLRGTRMEDVIFSGTRDRKPTGMAEVTLTLVDPALCGDQGGSEDTEVDIQNDLNVQDWDEAQLRASNAEETEKFIEDVRPGAAVPNSSNGTEQTAGRAEAESGPGENQDQVVLRVRRRKFNSQLKTGEIAVTRRLFRSGESEYLLNGKLCRLRDIQDIFMGTGLGPESYAIIEQGHIGQLLSGKPGDRRLIIEEAAGVTRFKARKRLAELRLEQAKQNLARIHDIFDEVTRQMNSLKRQAAKAERYATLRDEMRGRCRTVLASKFAIMAERSAHLEVEIASLDQQLRGRGSDLEQMDAQFSSKRDESYRSEAESKATLARISQIQLEEDRSIHRKQTNDERCTELETNILTTTAELERVQNQHQAATAELEANRMFLESVATELAGAQRHANERQRNLREATAAIQAAEAQQQQRRQSLLETMNDISQLRSKIAQIEENLTSLLRDADRLTLESENAGNEIDALGGRRGQLNMEFEGHAETLQGLDRRIQELRQQLMEKRQQETENKNVLDSLRAQYATTLGKRNSLEAVIAEHGYSTESVRRLFQSGSIERGFSAVGVLADFLEVDNQYERVVDDFLKDELNYIVVKSWDAAAQGMHLLKTDVEGRATFLVHPEDSQAKFSFIADESGRSSPPATLVPLTRCVRVLNGFGRSLEVILPKLRDGFITADAESARNLALENPNAFFLAPSGECFHNVTVTGGRQRSEGPLALKRELRDVTRLVEELQRDVQTRELAVAGLAREIGEASQLLDRLEEEHREAERFTMTSEHALKQLETELTRNFERRNQYEIQLARTQEQRAEKEELATRILEQAAAADLRREELQSVMNTVQEAFAHLQATRDAMAQKAGETQAAMAALEERRRSATSAFDRIQMFCSELETRLQNLESQIAKAADERHQRQSDNIALQEQLGKLRLERDQATLLFEQQQIDAEQLRSAIAALDEQLRSLRSEIDALRHQRGGFSAELIRLGSDIDHLESTCLDELNETAQALSADPAILRLEGEALEAEHGTYRDLKTRLEAMGPVNMMALEEYKETAERHSFLENQRKDLLESIENTQSTIREIDAISQEKFASAFQAINENFQAAFRKLFGGGQGFMRLTDEENAFDSGIDIIASPPGKKLQNVLLLSGGEKAMTALALLVGIFQYQPSPFCVLDEVDAPLDETNVGRFADLVREMSGQTQFVLITHSKRTMAAAPVLYGVTMQEPGVSKIVSVRFAGEQLAKISA